MSYLKFEHKNPRTLYGIIRYVKMPANTIMHGFGINPETAFEEMELAKRLYNQTDGRQYKHYHFSFDKGINLPANTLLNIGYNIGIFFAAEYQILMAIHFDTDNIHFHYILNTVNMVTGKKFVLTKGDIYRYKQYINRILGHYNLPLIKLYDGTDEVDDLYTETRSETQPLTIYDL